VYKLVNKFLYIFLEALMEKRNTTLKDIAAALGVTPMTVSKALNNHPDISESRRKEVFEAAERMNYVPNAQAKNLRTASSHLIGAVVADNSNPYFAHTLRGIEQVLSVNNYQTLIFNSDEKPEKEKVFINSLRSLNVAGVIICPALGNRPSVEILKEYNIPYVLSSRFIDESTDIYVVADDVHTGYIATSYLLEKKGEHIIFINGNMEISTARGRLDGYKKAFAEKGLAIHPEYIYSDALNISDGYRITKRILESTPLPFSLLCYSDYIAIGALQALSKSHVRIPEDVALMGIDNIEYSAFTNPKLSTVALPSMQIGTAAANLLLKIIKSPTELDIKSRQIILKPQLIIRDSA
jgi:DNA-binding LacI/PurR family transcriptional regulator